MRRSPLEDVATTTTTNTADTTRTVNTAAAGSTLTSTSTPVAPSADDTGTSERHDVGCDFLLCVLLP